MRLTTKGRFAVTAMIDLALRETNGPVTLAGISQRQKISLSYLEQLFGKLRRFNIVESTRGPEVDTLSHVRLTRLAWQTSLLLSMNPWTLLNVAVKAIAIAMKTVMVTA